MASTYSPLLRLELMTTGEKNGQWGDITNTNLASILEQAVAGTVTISITGATSPITLTENYGAADQSRSAILYITGTNASPISIIAPANSKLYYVNNTSNQTITLKTSVSTGVALLANTKQFVLYNIGTNDFVVATTTGNAGTVTSVNVSGGSTGLTASGGPITSSGTVTLGGTLAIANGGTGASTQSGAINALLPSQSSQSGKFLTTNGTDVSWGVAGSGGVGTVTSIQMSGGSTGLSFTGGPITTSGTFTLGGGPLGIGFGGTGANTAGNARINLGLGDLATQNSVSLSSQVSGTLSVANLSTGTNGYVLTMSSGVPTWSSSTAASVSQIAYSVASGAVHSLTGVPAGVKKITLLVYDLSSSSGNRITFGLTSSSGVSSGTYSGNVTTPGGTNVDWAAGYAYMVNNNSSGFAWAGIIEIARVSGNNWVISGQVGTADSDGTCRQFSGRVTMSAEATGVFVGIESSGSFDNGGISVQYQS